MLPDLLDHGQNQDQLGHKFDQACTTQRKVVSGHGFNMTPIHPAQALLPLTETVN